MKNKKKIPPSRTPKQAEEIKRSVLETIRDIEKRKLGGEFEPIPNDLCGWCEYRPLCPVWKHLYKKDENTPSAEEIKGAISEYLGLKADAQKNTKRIKELYAVLVSFMQGENVLRVFSDDGYISRTVKTADDYYLDVVRPILEPLGKWSEILKADERKLTALIPTLPPEVQDKIAAFATSKTTETLTVSRKRVSTDNDVVADEKP